MKLSSMNLISMLSVTLISGCNAREKHLEYPHVACKDVEFSSYMSEFGLVEDYNTALDISRDIYRELYREQIKKYHWQMSLRDHSDRWNVRIYPESSSVYGGSSKFSIDKCSGRVFNFEMSE